jgi:hypothetical protein
LASRLTKEVGHAGFAAASVLAQEVANRGLRLLSPRPTSRAEVCGGFWPRFNLSSQQMRPPQARRSTRCLRSASASTHPSSHPLLAVILRSTATKDLSSISSSCSANAAHSAAFRCHELSGFRLRENSGELQIPLLQYRDVMRGVSCNHVRQGVDRNSISASHSATLPRLSRQIAKQG